MLDRMVVGTVPEKPHTALRDGNGRLRYEELAADPGELERLLRVGAEKARAASAPTLESMYDRMGFARP